MTKEISKPTSLIEMEKCGTGSIFNVLNRASYGGVCDTMVYAGFKRVPKTGDFYMDIYSETREFLEVPREENSLENLRINSWFVPMESLGFRADGWIEISDKSKGLKVYNPSDKGYEERRGLVEPLIEGKLETALVA